MKTLCHVFAAVALALVTLLPARAAHADVFVVVNSANGVHAMGQKEVLDIFMGRTRAFPGGEFAQTLDLPRDAPARAAFYTALTGLSPAQLASYWSRLMFSGRTMPPQQMTSEAAMVENLRRNPGAIGYLAQEPSDRTLRVVLVLKESR